MSQDLPVPLPCPFCGRQPGIDHPDTLYPSGTGWKQDGEFRSYHSFREVPREQWCYGMHCDESCGGCGAAIYGDSAAEAVNKWNARACMAPLQERVRELEHSIGGFFSACCYLDRALPLSWVPAEGDAIQSSDDNPTRIRKATDEILRLRAELSRLKAQEPCPMCRGTGREGIPGAHCSWCDGTGKFMRGAAPPSQEQT